MLKAYKVHCHDEDHGCCIKFAQRAKDVDKLSNSEHCDCELFDRMVHREPRFDQYAPGPITITKLLSVDHWQYPCAHCEKWLAADDSPLIDDAGGRVVCNLQCARDGIADYSHLGDDCDQSIKDFRESMRRIISASQDREATR